MSTKEELESVIEEIEDEAGCCEAHDDYARGAARLILAARQERDEAKREARTLWDDRDEIMKSHAIVKAERDAARSDGRLRNAEADRNADIATRLEAERDAALAQMQELEARLNDKEALGAPICIRVLIG